MPITVYWNNDSNTPCTLRPAPLVSISLNVNKNSAGEAFGATYSITLTGTILADRGNPFGAYSINGTPFQVDDNGSQYVPPIGASVPGAQGRYGPRNLFHSGSQYGSPDAGPPPQIVSNDYALDSIFSKQRAIRALFARDGQLMEIIPVNGDSVAIACNPRVVSVSFSEGVYVDKCDYSIELEADTLRSANGAVDNEGLVKYWKEGSAFAGNLDGSTVYDATTEAQYILNGEYFISDFSEDWTLDTDEANAQTNQDGFLVPRTYSITHNISAVGKTHYLPDGTKLRAWQQAKGFVQNKLLTFGTTPPAGPIRNYPNSDNTSTTVDGVVTSDINSDPSVIAGMIGKGTLDLIAAYGGYNRVISEQIDEAAGSYSVTETWLLASGTAYETYNGSTWTTSPYSVSSGRQQYGGAGTQTAMFIAGGETPSVVNTTEENTGSSWTSGTNMPVTATDMFASGTLTAAVVSGFRTSPSVTTTLTYDGTSWGTAPSMSNPYWGGASGGTQTAAIAAGGAKTPGPQTDITEEFTGVTETVTAKTLTTS